MKTLFGNQLSQKTQREALRRFVYRFTKEHCPAWAKELREDGSSYPVQFASDLDWLAHTEFNVNLDGSLCEREAYCHSLPTWPDNPELRTTTRRPNCEYLTETAV